MMNIYKLSIITVSFNAVSTIEETIKSVLSQDYQQIEYIVIDGGSTDGTQEILNRYSDSISWISEKDEGVYDAMNKGMLKATGDFVYFLGADDMLYANDTISRVLNSIHSSNSLYYGRVLFKNSKKVYGRKTNKYRLSICNIPHQAIFYPKSFYVGKAFNCTYKLYADYDFNMRCYKETDFFYTKDIIAIYNEDGLSSSRSDFVFGRAKAHIILSNLGVLPFYYCKLRMALHLFFAR